jgi:hypothetical protein
VERRRDGGEVEVWTICSVLSESWDAGIGRGGS